MSRTVLASFEYRNGGFGMNTIALVQTGDCFTVSAPGGDPFGYRSLDDAKAAFFDRWLQFGPKIEIAA